MSFELAEHLLGEFEPKPRGFVMLLAQVIQDAAEAWINDAERQGVLNPKRPSREA